jgi:ATP-dependent Zn protease
MAQMSNQSLWRVRYIWLVLLVASLIVTASCGEVPSTKGDYSEWNYKQFIQAVEQGQISLVRISGDQSQAMFTTLSGENVLVTLPSDMPDLINTLEQHKVDIILTPDRPRFDSPHNLVRFEFLIPALLSLATWVVWAWALIECATKEAGGSDTKLVWLLIILLTSAVGAIAYFFIRRPRRYRELGR